MTCKWNGFFSVGEDFDDEDLLGTDWSAPSVPGQANVSKVAPSSNVLCESTVATNCQKTLTESTAVIGNGPGLEKNTQPAAVGQAVSLGFRQLSKSVPQHSSPRSVPPPRPPSPGRFERIAALQPSSATVQQTNLSTGGQQNTPVPHDDFDDWDVDLADLDESYPQMATGARIPETYPTQAVVDTAKRLRPSACPGAQTVHSVDLRGFSSSIHTSGPPTSKLPVGSSSNVPFLSPVPPRSASVPAPPQSPGVFPGLTTASPFSSPFPKPTTPRPVRGTPQPQRHWATPGAQGPNLFDAISPGPSSASCLTPRPLHTPILTNHLVQLVSASNRTPQRASSNPSRPKTRRFPGPAGLLPQQPHGQSLDDIVVAIPQTPAHGAMARLPSQVPSSQNEEEEFSGGPWAAMKAEMGLDERNPSCFLHSYSIVMVKRKAALKQLAKNKVPNIAVILKSILHTHADAKAVFRDPTGEMLGTVHRRLLEDRLGELKTGAVLLLKQVGVFSPSNRNHYLNVTPNNLLRIYPPVGVGLSSTPLPPVVLEQLSMPSAPSTDVPGVPVSRMELDFADDEEEEVSKEPCLPYPVLADSRAGCSGAPHIRSVAAPPQDQAWEEDDDLDELLGELPVETYSL